MYSFANKQLQSRTPATTNTRAKVDAFCLYVISIMRVLSLLLNLV